MQLLEREDELRHLQAAAGAAAAGAGRVVLVEGPAGIGKSALLDAAAVGCPRVLRARGTPLEREVAHGGARQLLEREVRALPADRRAQIASGAAAAGLAVVEPQASLPQAAALAAHGLTWLVTDLAEDGPLLILVDDLQWLDRPTQRWLGALAATVGELPVLLVAARRTGEGDVDEDVLDALFTVADAVLRPAPLSPGGTAQLLGTGSFSLAEACHEATRGNPLLVRDLGRTVAAVPEEQRTPATVLRLGAQAVAERAAARLRRRSPDARALARAVAVLGPGCALHDAATLAGLDGDAAPAAADELVAAGLLRSAATLAFEHPLIAQAVLEAIPVHERGAAHRRAARVLDEAGAPARAVAAHLLLAPPGDSPRAAERLTVAGEEAFAAGAFDGARRLAGRALTERSAESHWRALLVAGSAAWSQGDAAARDLLARGRDAAPEGEAKVLATVRHGGALAWFGDHEGAAAALAAAADRSEDGDLRLRLEAARASMQLARRGAPTAPVLERLERLGAEAAGAPGDGARLMRGALGYGWAVVGGRPAREVAVLCRGMPAPTGADFTGSEAFLPTFAAIALVAADDHEGADAAAASLEAAARRTGSPLIDFAAMTVRCYQAWALGDLADAIAYGRQGEAAARRTGFSFFGRGVAYLDRPLADAGHVEEALVLAPRGALDAGDMASLTAGYGALRALAVAGRWPEVLAAGERCAAAATVRGLLAPSAPWRLPLAEAHHHLGSPDRTRMLLAEQRAITESWDTPRLHALTLRTEGLLLDEPERLEAAVAAVEGTPFKLELASSLLALGAHRRRAGARVASREPLLRAQDLAARCGAEPLQERAREELLATGARPRRLLLTGAAALTASELRVCRLAAAGRSNPEIAQELWITRKTVEKHLSQAFRKLDVTAREQLPDALGSGAAVPDVTAR